MHDPEKIESTLGGALVSNNIKETVYYDPQRATESIIAHELMHSILHRSNWPRMYGLYPEEDRLSKNIANAIDNILDQYIFDPIFIERGFELNKERQLYVNELYRWPNEEHNDPGLILRDAFNILQGLFFENFYKKHVIQAVSKNHPTAYRLANHLKSLIDQKNKRGKFTIREAMKAILEYVNNWLSQKLNYEQDLQSRIGISPLFCVDELKEPAIKFIKFHSYLTQFNQQPMWVGSYSTQIDNVRFLNLLALGAYSEPEKIEKMGTDLEILSVGDLLETQEMYKYALSD